MPCLPSPQPGRQRTNLRRSLRIGAVRAAVLAGSLSCSGRDRGSQGTLQLVAARVVVASAGTEQAGGAAGTRLVWRDLAPAHAGQSATVRASAVDRPPQSAPFAEQPQQPATLLWRAGSSLAAAPAIGPDGAIYVASGQGTLDVLEASGSHRFTITLGGAPTGAVFVDDRGWAYVGLATGKLLGITPLGQKAFTFQAPMGIRGGVGFAAGQGLLVLGYDDVVIGVNRGGFPTMRIEIHGHATTGPLGILGWCVVGTATGEILWGDRWGKRRKAEVGAALRALQPTISAGVWALSETGLSAFSPKRALEFRRHGVLAMATAPRVPRVPKLQGALLTSAFELEWVDESGSPIARRLLRPEERASLPVAMRLDAEAQLWLVSPDRTLRVFGPNGKTEPPRQFRSQTLLEPVFDAARRRTIVATVEGEVYGLNWRRSE
jgi:hypothetical protein